MTSTYQTDLKLPEKEPVPGLVDDDDEDQDPPYRDDPVPNLAIRTNETVTSEDYNRNRRSTDNGNKKKQVMNEKTSIMKSHSNLASKWFNIYIATFPLAFIFLFDILPSRVSLIFIGHLLKSSDKTGNVDILYDFDAMFAAYGFTNFFVVFILSLSCGLDTLSKQQLRNIEYFRHACVLVLLGVIPYIVACIYARDILSGLLKQPSFIIEKAHYGIQYLIGYCLCYVIFAMLRKSLLQYLNSSLLVGIMFVRLCIHCMLGYFLYEYNSTNLGFYCFAISDSVSMIILLLITIVTLTKFVNLTEFLKGLLCINSRQGYKQIMDNKDKNNAINGNRSINVSNNGNKANQISEKTRESQLSANASFVDKEAMQSQTWSNVAHTSMHDNNNNSLESQDQGINLFKEYIHHMIIPGAISCLEWWAVEALTWLVGALPESSENNIYINYFVHAVYSSFLLLVQMPMLGLSVAMAAIITANIRLGRYQAAYNTFLQGIGSSLVYCVFIAFVVFYFYNKGLLTIFFDLPNESDLNNNDDYRHEYNVFVYEIYNACASINLFFVIVIFAYSVAMCFLALFVSVGRLDRGGMFMLVGYYICGLIISVVLGYVLKMHLYGIWLGYACGFAAWCVLSMGYWLLCSKWESEMKTMKTTYDTIEKYEKGTQMFKQKLANQSKNYGTMN